MKKIMIFTIIALALALATSACDDQPEEQEEILRGYITEFGTNKQIPVYQSAGVPDDKAIAMTNRITDPKTFDQGGTGYAAANPGNKTAIHDKIQKIVIVNGTGITCTPDGVVSIGADNNDNWNDILTHGVKVAVEGGTTITVP